MSYRRSYAMKNGAAVLVVTWCIQLQAIAGIKPNEWKFSQSVEVSQPGMVRLNLPAETLNVAQPDLSDVRLLDLAGAEMAYVVEQPRPVGQGVVRPKDVRIEIDRAITRLIVINGNQSRVHAILLDVPPGVVFLKAAQIEASRDGRKWQTIAERQPIFRTATGASKLRIDIPEEIWEYLRVNIDDSQTPAVPFTGLQLAVAGMDAPTEPLPVKVTSRDESPGVTRLTVTLGRANLTPAFLRIDTPEHLFTRAITLAVPELNGDAITERTVGTGVIYRLDLNGKTESQLDVPLETQIRGRELVILIRNDDSPPLMVNAIQAERRVQRLLFRAPVAGRYTMLVGNPQASAPVYDLSAITERLTSAAAIQVAPGALVANPNYQMADKLVAFPLTGANIDVSGWKFRKKIEISADGVHQLELDADILARSANDQRDVRIVRDHGQIPFLLERTSIARQVTLAAVATPDSKRPTASRWMVKLPQSGMPFTQVSCTVAPGIFEREVRLFENITDEQGTVYPRELASGRWQSVSDQPRQKFAMKLNVPPATDTVFIETDNGDNPPITLQTVSASYPVTRVIFKVAPDATAPVWLYYGNSEASSPRYDVNLVANQFLRAQRTVANLGSEEKMESTSERVATNLTGAGRYLFWATLALVVGALLWLISRLLPSPAVK